MQITLSGKCRTNSPACFFPSVSTFGHPANNAGASASDFPRMVVAGYLTGWQWIIIDENHKNSIYIYWTEPCNLKENVFLHVAGSSSIEFSIKVVIDVARFCSIDRWLKLKVKQRVQKESLSEHYRFFCHQVEKRIKKHFTKSGPLKCKRKSSRLIRLHV